MSRKDAFKQGKRTVAILMCFILLLSSADWAGRSAFAQSDDAAYESVIVEQELAEEPSQAPVENPTTEPMADPTAEPPTTPAAEPGIDPTAGQAAEPTAGPMEAPTAAAEPTEGPAAELPAETTGEPALEATPEPTAEPAAGTTPSTTEAVPELTIAPTDEATEEVAPEPTEEPALPTPDSELVRLFGHDAMYLEDFLTLYPDALLDGARYGSASVPRQLPAKERMNPALFEFLIPGDDGAGAVAYASVASLGAAYDVAIPDASRGGENWIGPVSGVQASEYRASFPVVRQSAGGVEYRPESLLINDHPIDGMGDVIFDTDDGDNDAYVYLYLSELPRNRRESGYVVLSANRLRIQVAYAVQTPTPTEGPGVTEEPETTEEAVETEALETPEEPVETEESETTEVPEGTEEPEATEEPAIAEDPVANYWQWLQAEAEKSSVLYKVLYENWDPYSATMTMAEFHELMGLFERGVLPLKNMSPIAKMSLLADDGEGDDAPVAEPDGTADDIIPRDMFVVIGLEGSTVWEALPDSPNGKMPKVNWPGFQMGEVYDSNGQVKMSEDETSSAAFPRYDNEYYVYSIIARNVAAVVLGIIQTKDDQGNPKYVYYYLTSKDQSDTVSTTMIDEKEKFTIRYARNEYDIDYLVELDGADVTALYADAVFGTGRPTRTNLGEYAFDVHAPNGYTAGVYLRVNGAAEDDDLLKKNKINAYGDENETHYAPLGTDPTYTGGMVNTKEGPLELLMSARFEETDVKQNTTIVVKLKKKDPPKFDMSWWLTTNNASGRGTAGTINEPGGPNWPNIVPDELNVWQWNGGKYSRPVPMYAEEGGTYGYELVFQTNTGSGGYTLDKLQFNGVDLAIPFTPQAEYIKTELIKENGEIEGASYTTATLPDGAVVRIDLIRSFLSNPDPQRVYKITITGAYSSVTVTSGNLMQGTGAPEIAFENIADGIYCISEDDQILKGTVQYFDYAYQKWMDATDPIIVNEGDNRFGFKQTDNGDPEHDRYNFRFMLEEGYDTPIYKLTQSDTDRTVIEHKGVPQTGEAVLDEKDGYYYFRIDGQGDISMAMLTIEIHTTRYVVRYLPGVMNVPPDDGGPPTPTPAPTPEDPAQPTVAVPTSNMLYRVATNMPNYSSQTHLINSPFFDDNQGIFYDVITHKEIAVNGNIPKDPGVDNGLGKAYAEYVFDHWELVGEGQLDSNGAPTERDDQSDNEWDWKLPKALGWVDIAPGSLLSLDDIKEYAVPNSALDISEDTSIRVIRLQAVWRKINDPVTYSVTIKWVDAQGIIHESEAFEIETVTTERNGDRLVVFVNKDAEPIRNWLAQHPTYSIWDAVNNAKSDKELEDAIKDAFKDNRTNITPDDLQRPVDDDTGGYDRLGKYAFEVLPDGSIDIWVHENKGGLVFRNVVEEAAFGPDEEFYYTVTHVGVGANSTADLNGVYFAYPWPDRGDATVADEYTVTYEDGKITNIVKGGKSLGTTFTLKDGEGIRLYVPPGRYTLSELGSKSGGRYKVDVTFDNGNGATDAGDVVDFGGKLKDDLWVKGSSMTAQEDTDDISQVQGTVQFEAGASKVIQTLTFTNQTISVAIDKRVTGPSNPGDTFTFDVMLILPDNDTPMTAGDGNYYYDMVVYDVNEQGELISGNAGTISLRAYDEAKDASTWLDNEGNKPDLSSGSGNAWVGQITLKGSQRAVIVTQVLNDGINYYVKERAPGLDDAWVQIDPGIKHGHVGVGEQGLVTIENTYFSGLTINLTVVDQPEKLSGITFEYTLQMTKDDGTAYTGSMKVRVLEANGRILQQTVDFDGDGKGTISLTDGQSMSFDSLQQGYKYEISQVQSSTGDKYMAIYATDRSGAISQEASVVQFLNVRLYGLSVSKTVTGNMGSRVKEFEFKLTLKSNPYGLTQVDYTTSTGNKQESMALSDNAGTFRLRHGETIVFDLPYGTEYVVEELDQAYSTKHSWRMAGLSLDNDGKSLSHTLSDDTKVDFENTLNGVVPTGAHVALGWMIPLMLVSLAGLSAVLYKRRRRW